MSDQGQDAPQPVEPAPAPVSPSVGWVGASRVEQLATWIMANRSAYTDAALGRSAEAGGYSAEEIAAALELAAAREHERGAMQPIRSRAKWLILGAYGLVWLLFALVYLGRTTGYGQGPFLQGILTVALILGLLVSAVFLRILHPDPDRAGRALTILLVVPVVVLLGITGLCLPFVGTA